MTVATKKPKTPKGDVELIQSWKRDWNKFAREALGVTLDTQQQAILESVQYNPRTIVKSGHARGKDYVCGVIAICSLYLRVPSKVLCTGPTDRQVKRIMLAEAQRIWAGARIPLGGVFKTDGLFFPDDPTWYLLGFKTDDNNTEAWTGFHSPNPTVIVTEGSGISDDIFNTLEGLLTGDSRLVIVLNPNNTSGECYRAFRSDRYARFTLSCLEAPNVVAGETIIPGQVDRKWVDELMHKPGWAMPIPSEAVTESECDFEWRGKHYRPSNLFRVKVLGQFPKESSDQLIPLSWVEASHERWRSQITPPTGRQISLPTADRPPLMLGVDVAGMGIDNTVLVFRYGNLVSKTHVLASGDHMQLVGYIGETLHKELGVALIDTIGEGAGVYSRCRELELPCESVKFSEGANDLTDLTGERTFANMRAYCWWAVRDALDPAMVPYGGGQLALPPSDELTMDLTEPRFIVNSAGKILIEAKDRIKERLGRSPDYGDALSISFYPGGVLPDQEFTVVEDLHDEIEHDLLMEV